MLLNEYFYVNIIFLLIKIGVQFFKIMKFHIILLETLISIGTIKTLLLYFIFSHLAH